VGYLRPRERWADHFAERSLHARADLALVPAHLDLIPLLAVLIDAQDADVADVVVAAGIHAAGDVEVELADVVQVVQIVEAPLDRFGHRDRLGVGERAEVYPRAGDDVREEAQVRRREAELPRLAPHGQEI